MICGQPSFFAILSNHDTNLYFFTIVKRVRANPYKADLLNGISGGSHSKDFKLSSIWWDEFNEVFNSEQSHSLSSHEMAAQKKMIDQINVLNKRADESEYGASNYT